VATGPTKKFDDIFSRLGRMHERDRQTDRLTDTGPQQRPRLRIASRGKNLRFTLRKVEYNSAKSIKIVEATLYVNNK